jgi:hypothetical protein
MIDRNKKIPAIVIAKKIAEKYINNPIIDTFGDGKEVKKIKNISVILEEHAVYLNTELEKVQDLAAKKKHTVIVVMENGKVIEDHSENEDLIEEPEPVTPPVDKGKKSKLKL